MAELRSDHACVTTQELFYRGSSLVHACAPEELPSACMRAGGAPSFMHARRRSSLVHACAPRELLSACMAHRRSSVVHACARQELPRSCMRAGRAPSSVIFRLSSSFVTRELRRCVSTATRELLLLHQVLRDESILADDYIVPWELLRSMTDEGAPSWTGPTR